MGVEAKQGVKRPPGAVDQLPLISTKYVDHFQQRQLALSICALVQVIKAAEALSYNIYWTVHALDDGTHSSSADHGVRLLLKYGALDTLLLGTIILFRVFSKRLSRNSVLLSLSAIWFINFLLFGRWSLVSLPVTLPGVGGVVSFLTEDYVVTTSEKRIRISQLQNLGNPQSRRGSQGHHAIRVLPYATAVLNPRGEAFCIDKAAVNVPIVFNNTDPAFFSIKILNLEGTASRLWNISVDELHFESTGIKRKKKLLSKHLAIKSTFDNEDDPTDDEESDEYDTSPAPIEKHTDFQSNHYGIGLDSTQSLYTLPLSSPGVYSLHRVQDMNGSDIRPSSSEVILVSCPSASIELDQRDSDMQVGSLDLCVGESYHVTILIQGVPPLKLTYQRQSAGVPERKVLESIGASPESGSRYAYQNISIPLASTLSHVGEHGIVIEKVEDFLGNTRAYSIRKAQSSTSTQGSYAVRVFAHSRASISWRSGGGELSADLLENQTVDLPILVEDFSRADGPPWQLKLGLSKTGNVVDNMLEKTWDKTLDRQIYATPGALAVSENGTYVLLAGKGKYCAARIREPSAFLVNSVLPPQMHVDFKDLQDECAGAVGMRAELLFLSGRPPFTVQYDVYRHGILIDSKEHSFSAQAGKAISRRHSISYAPPDEARYRYFFKRLDDANYKNRSQNFQWTQEVRPLATAYIKEGQQANLRSCSGDTFALEVIIRGQGPWSLDYELVYKGKVEVKTIHNISETHPRFELPVPSSVRGSTGHFTVGLTAITDVHGCRRTLDSAPVQVEMRRDKPTANFESSDANDDTIQILEGQMANIPLRLTGIGPWTVQYRVNDKLHEVKVPRPNDNLLISAAGMYELVSVKDHHCPGLVGNHKHKNVLYYPKPTLAFRTAGNEEHLSQDSKGNLIRKSVCVNTSDHQDLELRGSPPFELTYQVVRDGHSEPLTFVNAALEQARIVLRTEKAGHYRYNFQSIGDENYPSTTLLGRHKGLEQTVFQLPSVHFRKPLNTLYLCKGSSFSEATGETIGISLSGSLPFALKIAIVHEATGTRTIEHHADLTKHETFIEPDFRPTRAGRYSLRIIQVNDGNGCQQKADSESGASLTPKLSIEVVDSAKISAIDSSSHACVGDTLEYALEGNSPYMIEYEFKGHTHRVKQKGSHFARVPDEAGRFEIISIQQSNSRCESALDFDAQKHLLAKTVHSLPMASLREQGGMKDIREGEEASVTFDLHGEPPFNFRWQRIDTDGRVAEEHMVTDLSESFYTITTNQGGYFQITYLRDRYCSFPRHLDR